MSDLEIANQHHMNFPTHYSANFDFSAVGTLHIHHCSYFKIDLHGDSWKNLQEINISDSKYLELRITLPPNAQLTKFHLENTEFTHIKDFIGGIALQQIEFHTSKYLKISGPWKDLGVIEMKFIRCPYLELFKGPGLLTKLQKMTFTDCSFATIDGKFHFPELELVEIHNSPYLKLKKPETNLPKLRKIIISNSSYAQIPASARCPNLKIIDITHSKYVQVPKSLQNTMLLKTEHTNLIDPEEIQKKHLGNAPIGILSALDSPTKELIMEKFCPYCGNKMDLKANKCLNCQASFEE